MGWSADELRKRNFLFADQPPQARLSVLIQKMS
jgi:hypothetical protein